MNWFDHIISSQFVHRMGWTVLHSLWQGILLAVILALALLLIPKRKNNLRYFLSCLALFALFAAFIATASLIPPRPDNQPAANPWIEQPTTQQSAAMEIPATVTATVSDSHDKSPAEPAETPQPTQTSTPTPSWKTRIAKTVSPWIAYVTCAWFIGVFAMSVWNLGGFIAVRRLRLIGTWPVRDNFIETLKHLAKKFSIRRTVKLLQSTVVKTPMTIGWLKPVILIPASVLSELSTEQIEAIIAHELAHIRRYDYLVNILQTLAETLLFHHPAVWWISHRIRTEREYCCDNAVLKLTSDQVNYAKALTSIAEMRNTLPQIAVAATGGSLLSRIRRILTADGESSLLRNRSAGWAFVALMIVVGAFAIGVELNNDRLLAVSHKYGANEDNGEYRTLQKMVGNWTVDANQSRAIGNVRRIEIKPDATCIRHEAAAGQENKTFYDRIRLKNNKLTVSGYWGKQSFDLKLEDNTMIWTDGQVKITFERATNTPPAKETAQASIIGTWRSTNMSDQWAQRYNSITITFGQGGSGNAANLYEDGRQTEDAFTWEFDGPDLLLGTEEPGDEPEPDDQWEPLLWRIDNDILYLTDDDEERTYKYTRLPFTSQARTATLPDVDKRPVLLDLASGESFLVPREIKEDRKASAEYLSQLKKGDLSFEAEDDLLIVYRGGEINGWDGQKAGAWDFRRREEFNTRLYKLPSIPCRVLVKTAEGRQFDVTALAKTKEGDLQIEYRPVGSNTEPAGAKGIEEAVGMMAPLYGLFSAAYKALNDENDPEKTLAVLGTALPQLDQFAAKTRGTQIEEPVAMAIDLVRQTATALKNGDVNKAKALMGAINTAGPQLEEMVRKAAPAKNASGSESIESPVKVVEQWMTLAGAGRDAQAMKLTTQNKADQADDMRSIPNGDSITPKHALANDRAALVVTTETADDFDNRGVLVFRLFKKGQTWLIDDIDFESPQRSEGIMEGFQSHPGVRTLDVPTPSSTHAQAHLDALKRHDHAAASPAAKNE